jgi:hypothetical protein
MRQLGCAMVLLCSPVALSTYAATSIPSDYWHRSAMDIVVDKAANDYFRNLCHVGGSMAAAEARTGCKAEGSE